MDKQCGKCGLVKDISQFLKLASGRPSCFCIACVRKKTRFFDKDPEKSYNEYDYLLRQKPKEYNRRGKK